ncbi:MAG: hypothetical protein ACRC41_03435 [Sarcina sp.]
MKGKKFLFTAIAMMTLTTSFISCTNKNNVIEGGGAPLTNGEIERLPEDQKDSELDKKLTQMREFRKKNIKIENGSMSAISYNDKDLLGQSENRPEFNKEEYKIIFNIVYDYLAKKLDIDRSNEIALAKIDNDTCIDPRINKIYDNEDKGVANGYENENIYVHEYEDTNNSYKYLIMVKEKNIWKVIHDGENYLK